MATQGNLKRHDGSEANAMAAKMNVKALLQCLNDKLYPSLGLCLQQMILEETPVLHICDHYNQCHGTLLASVYASDVR